MVWLCLLGVLMIVLALESLAFRRMRQIEVKLAARSVEAAEERKRAAEELRNAVAELKGTTALLGMDLATLQRLILGSVREPAPEPVSKRRPVPDLPPVDLAQDEREAAPPPHPLLGERESDEEVTKVGPGVVVALGAPQVLQALREFERACDVAELAKEARVMGLLKLGTLADVQGAIAEVQVMVTESGERDAAAIGGLLASRVIQRKRASARRSTIRPPAPARHIPEPA